jgi:hypothetical protein
MIMSVEQSVLGENLPHGHFVHQKPLIICPELEPKPLRWKARSNQLNCGTFLIEDIVYMKDAR